MHKPLSCRGQNVIEYVLLVMAVVVVLIAGVLKGGVPNNANEGTGPLVRATKQTMAGTDTLLKDTQGDVCSCVYLYNPSDLTCGQQVAGTGCAHCQVVRGTRCSSGECCGSACCEYGCCPDGTCQQYNGGCGSAS